MRCLVTGATGFIGSHLVNELKKENQVVVLERDCFRNKWLKKVLKDCMRTRGDVRNIKFMKRILSHYRIEHVYHLAAMAIVRDAYKNPIETFDVNVMGTLSVLDACRQVGVDKILVMSTDKVYGDQIEATETSRLRITEPYGTSKICADLIAQTYFKVFNLNVVVARVCNTYGYDPYNWRIIPNTIKSCLRGEDPIIYVGEDSSRQYIYVDDVVRSLSQLMVGGHKGVFNIAPTTFNTHLGRSGLISIKKTQEEVVMEVLKHFPDLRPRYIKRATPVEIKHQSMIAAFPSSACSFERGIRLTVEKFREYREDWK